MGESPPVVDLSGQGFPLVGGRIDYVGGQRTAVVVYRRHQHVIDVYVAPASQERQVGPPQQLRGYWLAAARVGGRSAWIISDIEEPELLRFRELLTGADSPAEQSR